MTRVPILLTLSFTLLAGAVYSIRQSEDPEVLLGAALHQEEVEGDLSAALEIYRRILTLPSVARDIRARAQFRIGACYERLGRSEAIQAYETVVSEYADQTTQVAAARTRLVELRANGSKRTAVVKIDPPKSFDDQVTPSPDGSRLAGIDYSIGQNLAVYDPATGEQELISHFDWGENSYNWAYHPVWSPDSTEIAYFAGTWDNSATEIQVATLGGETRTIYKVEGALNEGIMPCDWLADNSILAILTSSEGGRLVARIGLVPSGGGDFRPLKTIEDHSFIESLSCPKASPDGRFLVLTEGRVGSRDIQILSIDGQHSGTLTQHPADDHQPYWSPDGSHVAFLSLRHGSWALWANRVNEGKAEGPAFLLREGMQDSSLVSWTTGGITYSNLTRIRDIYVVSVDPSTGDPTGAPRLASYPSTGTNWSPAWSPDGQSLAFIQTDAQNRGLGFVVVLSPGGKARQFEIPVAISSPSLQDLRWLADGSGLGFSALNDQAEYTLFRLTLSDGGWRSWTIPVPVWTRIEWNPSGTGFYYARHGFGRPRRAGQEAGIVERNLETGEEVYVYQGGTIFRSMKASHDRKSLVFGQDNKLMVVLDLASGSSTVINSDKLSYSAWSPEGRSVLAIKPQVNPDGPGQLLRVPVDGSAPVPIDLGIKLPERSRLRSPDWSPDGTRIAFGVLWMRYETFQLKNPIPEK